MAKKCEKPLGAALFRAVLKIGEILLLFPRCRNSHIYKASLYLKHSKLAPPFAKKHENFRSIFWISILTAPGQSPSMTFFKYFSQKNSLPHFFRRFSQKYKSLSGRRSGSNGDSRSNFHTRVGYRKNVLRRRLISNLARASDKKSGLKGLARELPWLSAQSPAKQTEC